MGVSLAASHIHELVFRSHKLGGALDVSNTITLCPHCHSDMHTKIGGVLKRIEGAELGSSGALRFFERKTGKHPWVEVK